jgi:hypothetical protein
MGGKAEITQKGESEKSAVEIYEEIVGRPLRNQAAISLIEEAKIETRWQKYCWRKVVLHYIGTGWSENNVVGMLDFYKRGVLPTTRKGNQEQRIGGYMNAEELAIYFGLEPVSEDEDEDIEFYEDT